MVRVVGAAATRTCFTNNFRQFFHERASSDCLRFTRLACRNLLCSQKYLARRSWDGASIFRALGLCIGLLGRYAEPLISYAVHRSMRRSGRARAHRSSELEVLSCPGIAELCSGNIRSRREADWY